MKHEPERFLALRGEIARIRIEEARLRALRRMREARAKVGDLEGSISRFGAVLAYCDRHLAERLPEQGLLPDTSRCE